MDKCYTKKKKTLPIYTWINPMRNDMFYTRKKRYVNRIQT